MALIRTMRLNIDWIAEGVKDDATIICARSHNCPRDERCLGRPQPERRTAVEDVREWMLAD